MYQAVRQKTSVGQNSYLKILSLLGDHDSTDPILLFDCDELIRFLSGGGGFR